LAELFAQRGVPQHIRTDNGGEFIANAIERWLKLTEVAALYIAPAAPWENGYAEGSHGRLRDELLRVNEFAGLREARALTQQWNDDYNQHRPHAIRSDTSTHPVLVDVTEALYALTRTELGVWGLTRQANVVLIGPVDGTP
jgi:hypothetical protein